MATDVQDFVNRLVLAERHLQGGFPFWGRSLLSQQEQTQIQNRLQATKAFLESLQAYTNPNQLRNFDRDASAVREQKAGLDALREVEHLQKLVTWLGPAASYLSQAEVILPEDHPWVRQVREANKDVQEQIGKPGPAERAIAFAQQVNQHLEELIKGYLAAYITLHARRPRLGVNDGRRRAGLLRDQRLDRLRKLAAIDLVPGGPLAELENRLKNLIACPKLTEQDLQAGPLCPHCRFNPALEKYGPPLANVLTSINDLMDRLLSAWTKTLLDNLQDSAVRANLDLLAPHNRKPVAAFLKSGTLPDLTSDFIRALRKVFSGLVKVVLRPNELRAALLNGGTPATLPETRKRFDDYLGATWPAKMIRARFASFSNRSPKCPIKKAMFFSPQRKLPLPNGPVECLGLTFPSEGRTHRVSFPGQAQAKTSESRLPQDRGLSHRRGRGRFAALPTRPITPPALTLFSKTSSVTTARPTIPRFLIAGSLSLWT